jgi:hypothetical protein
MRNACKRCWVHRRRTWSRRLNTIDKIKPYVKVLEAWPYVDQYGSFPEWMKCWTRALWDLWTMMCDGDEMSMTGEKIDEFCPEVYYGWLVMKLKLDGAELCGY